MEMFGLGILGWILVGLVAGWIASVVMGTRAEQGILGDILVGILGAILGGFLFSLVGLETYGIIGSIIVATIGAIVVLWIKHALT